MAAVKSELCYSKSEFGLEFLTIYTCTSIRSGDCDKTEDCDQTAGLCTCMLF